MASLDLFRQRSAQNGGPGSRLSLRKARASLTGPRPDQARNLRHRRFDWAWAAFWFGAALTLSGIGIVIGTALESALLGFLGADFVFLLVVSIFTSGQSAPRRRH